ncbi:RNA pseudouridylate synthase family protein [Neorickettsia helminthoeca str. Oregon]|uniref:Ribosomal large subunit pseudouridine synthase C n=1 Tax=Neorickettsia helminthoeca str. Oregon TaxID=1286528 RepID=X5H4I5_9RICK|nr:RluA family pseudouridine synthase [Neorickettsia helminthoeca]AHX11476.1 RNA pseudouridylate synthase family protein [Neorickettsia helminthoeca str. Oregon]
MGIFLVENDCQRLDKYLRLRFGSFPQSALEKALRKKLIKLNGKRADAATPVTKGESIFLNPGFLNIISSLDVLDEKKHGVDSRLIELIISSIIYEDENILAINKPFGISVQSGNKVSNSIDCIMKAINPEYRVVHRLDKHTTGVLLFAKTLEATREIWQLFANRLISKKYLGIVVGKVEEKEGEIDCFIKKTLYKGEEIMRCNNIGDGERAITRFRAVSCFDDLSLVELYPVTGRKHQIRAQMANIGYPILNDGKYGRKHAFINGTPNKKMNLHAIESEFELFGKSITIKARLPGHFLDNTPKRESA